MKNTDKNIKILMMVFRIYEDQAVLEGKEVSRVEAGTFGTNCYCDEDAMNAIRSRIAPYSSERSILLFRKLSLYDKDLAGKDLEISPSCI